eukprot:scaffold294151_cov71-Attheya_sp.AAC.1
MTIRTTTTVTRHYDDWETMDHSIDHPHHTRSPHDTGARGYYCYYFYYYSDPSCHSGGYFARMRLACGAHKTPRAAPTHDDSVPRPPPQRTMHLPIDSTPDAHGPSADSPTSTVPHTPKSPPHAANEASLAVVVRPAITRTPSFFLPFPIAMMRVYFIPNYSIIPSIINIAVLCADLKAAAAKFLCRSTDLP